MNDSILPRSALQLDRSRGRSNDGRSNDNRGSERSNFNDRSRRKDFVHEIYMAQFIGQSITILMPGGAHQAGTLVGLDKFALVIRVPSIPAGEGKIGTLSRDMVIFKSAIDCIVADSKQQG